MPEQLSPGAALVGAGLGPTVPLVTDGRFSGMVLPYAVLPVLDFSFFDRFYSRLVLFIGVLPTLCAGASHGIMIGHVVPEAHSGGPIAVVNEGDIIEIDLHSRTLNVCISE